ncbi:MAG: DUF2079 domain-containing protein [Candidatus Eremiobacteraeota bacterium]|nr:DUF2079 domain-containing protein [Candidatus Eremiobacteraeota bacterium]MBC5802429.1 DUF2079 domain-containing protein [Candidatus Eremiobacteraeota bacterium]MBC5821618.1 DUF2079 domain-containing protein [Candidatus Eremiobacteraeota bacterium]
MFRVVIIAAAAFAVLYIALDFNALYALRANQNTGLYLQSIVDFVRTGSTFDQPDGKPHLFVHDQWLVYLALGGPVAWLPRPETLIVCQEVALAAAAIPLFLFARACGAPVRPAAALAVAFLLSPSVQGWAYDGFVAEDLIPVVAFSLALAVRARSLPWTLVAACLLLGTKEDEIWFLMWLGALGAVWFDRRLGLAVFTLAVVNGAVYYALTLHFGFLPEHPRYGIVDLQWPQQLTFLVEMLVPLGFAPLCLGRRLFVALPFLAELFLSQDRTYPLYHTGSFYTVPLVTLAALATAYVTGLRPRFGAYAFGGAAAMALLFNNASVLHLGRRPFSLDPQYAAARSWAITSQPIDFPCEDVGAWTVASPDLRARLVGCGHPVHRPTRPAWRDEPLGATAAWTRGAPLTARANR